MKILSKALLHLPILKSNRSKVLMSRAEATATVLPVRCIHITNLNVWVDERALEDFLKGTTVYYDIQIRV